MNFGIDILSYFIAVVSLLRDLLAQKYELFPLAECPWSQLIAHPVLSNHHAGNLCGALDVILAPGSHLIEDYLLGTVSAEQGGQHVIELGASHQIAVFGRQLAGVTGHHPPDDDGNLMHRIGVGHQASDQGMPGFMIGSYLLFFAAHQSAFPLRPGNDPVDRFLQFQKADLLLPSPGCQNGGLVYQVGEISTAEAGGLPGNDPQIDCGIQRFAPGMNLQYRLASVDVRLVQDDTAVKPPRAQERRVQNVRPVGGRKDDDVGIGVKAVHLREYLVQGLFPLIMSSTESRTTMAAHGIDFIDENYAGGVAFGLVEEVSNPSRTNADEHLHELATAYGEEGHSGLTGDRPAEERLPRPRRPDEEHPSRDTSPNGKKLFSIRQEFNNLPELLLCLFNPGNVREGYGWLIAGEHSGLAPGKAHCLIGPARSAAQQEE